MLFEVIRFVFYSGLIVLISKYVLVQVLRRLALSLRLKAKTVGNISGVATSIPEFLTISISSIRGLTGAGLYNILSSNIINLIQYLGTILLNKNLKKLNNGAIKVGVVLVILTVLIPLVLMNFELQLDIFIVLIFISLYILFLFLNGSASRFYLGNSNLEEKEKNTQKSSRRITEYFIILAITGIALFFITERLGNSIEGLCLLFGVPQSIVGIVLGFITSLPELITFFESQKYHKTGENDILGVVEATNNLLMSNCLNLFIIQAIGVILVSNL